jgi:hypothetical protein
MDIRGERVLNASRPVVWASLFDAGVLQQSVPGCESVVRESESVYRITTVLAIGPLKARFAGTLAIAEAEAPGGCKLVFQGQGGAAGMAQGTALVRLVETEQGTLLSYSADAQISGKLAQVGSRLIETVAKKLSGVFFEKFESAVSASVG